jgi:diadenylate cyclase
VSVAVSFLSKSQFGALIAIERNSRLGGLIDAGVALDALVDARLLESIFWPNSPLHDLGVVIRGDRILAASVQFPLAEEGLVSVEYGSRHRAAVGLSMESDCIVVIVSEETGGISIAEHGRLTSNIPRDDFRDVLGARLRAPVVEEPAPEPILAASAESSDPGTKDPDEKQAA